MSLPTRPLLASLGTVAVAAVTALSLASCGAGSTIVVNGSDGGVPGVGPSGQVTVSSSDGTLVVGGDSLPEGWPSDVGAPEGFTVAASATTDIDGAPAYTASFGADGDQTAAVTAWIDSLTSNGFTKEWAFGAGGGGVAALTSSTATVTVVTSVADGKTVVVVSVGPPKP